MLPRHIAHALKERFEYARSVYIFGPRQSGKTTLAKQLFNHLPYVTLEDPDTAEFFATDPRGFFAQFAQTKGGIIDEPQRDPKLFSYLQGQIDNEHKKFVLTSSQNFLMMESISQSLAGRISILNLLPLTRQEIERRNLVTIDYFSYQAATNNSAVTSQLNLHDNNCVITSLNQPNQTKYPSINEIWSFILYGGYPEIISNMRTAKFWFDDYIKTYIERDIRRIINVQNLVTFQRFLKLCAGRTGNILNKASLAADCGISETTCTKWLSLLAQSGVIILLKPYHNNFNKRQIKSTKLHFLDSGLCCNLLGIKTIEHLTAHPLIGSILETYVVSEFYKQYRNSGRNIEFYYWRDQHAQEIDLIIELENGSILPIEIKAGQTITNQLIGSLAKWCTLAKVDKGLLLYGGDTYQQRTNLNVIPISAVI